MDVQKRKAPVRLLRYSTNNSVFGELFEMFNYAKYKYVLRESAELGFQFFNKATKDEAMTMVNERVSHWRNDGLTVDVINEVSLN